MAPRSSVSTFQRPPSIDVRRPTAVLAGLGITTTVATIVTMGTNSHLPHQRKPRICLALNRRAAPMSLLSSKRRLQGINSRGCNNNSSSSSNPKQLSLWLTSRHTRVPRLSKATKRLSLRAKHRSSSSLSSKYAMLQTQRAGALCFPLSHRRTVRSLATRAASLVSRAARSYHLSPSRALSHPGRRLTRVSQRSSSTASRGWCCPCPSRARGLALRRGITLLISRPRA